MLAVSGELYQEGKECFQGFEDKHKLIPFGMMLQMAFRQQIRDTKYVLKCYNEAKEENKDYWHRTLREEVARLIMMSDLVEFEEDVCDDCGTHIWDLGEEEEE